MSLDPQTGAQSGTRYDIDGLLAEIDGVPASTDPTTVKRRSRDYFWYSPVLNAALARTFADVVVMPRDEAEVIRAVRAAVRRRIPITARGAGTGNYGQAVPLAGGILLDMTALDRLLWSKPGVVRAETGARLHLLDEQLRPGGFELRMHPSTKRSATIGGFVAGGSGGVGSITYGGLREPGNILAARIVTMEAEPRVLELRGDAAQKINRAYGTTGLITEIEMPTAPAWPWIDVIVAAEDFFEVLAIGRDVALADGIVKKLVSPIIWPIPSYFTALADHCPHGQSLLMCMIAAPSLESFKALVAGRGRITYEAPSGESAAEVPLYEYTWNHTTLQVLKSDRSVTYLQCLYPHDRLIDSVRQMWAAFPDEVLPHLEFIRFGGRVTCSALPIVRYRSPERLDEIIRTFEQAGVMIANPHVFTLEDGSRHKRADADQLGFKREVDPHGLLNPGKMRTYTAAEP